MEGIEANIKRREGEKDGKGYKKILFNWIDPSRTKEITSYNKGNYGHLEGGGGVRRNRFHFNRTSYSSSNYWFTGKFAVFQICVR